LCSCLLFSSFFRNSCSVIQRHGDGATIAKHAAASTAAAIGPASAETAIEIGSVAARATA
jgi:hypothetical protein